MSNVLKQFLTDMFPPRPKTDKLPLISREFILPNDTKVSTMEDRYLKGKAVARNVSHAQNLRKQHGKTAEHIAKIERRARRREGRISGAWRRFLKLWD
jgi:hypothetical protein